MYKGIKRSTHGSPCCLYHRSPTRTINHLMYLPCTYPQQYSLTYCMVQCPSWEANRFAAGQEISLNLCNPKVHYRIHKCPPAVPILNQLHPVHNPTSHFLSIRLNIIFPSAPGSPQWSPSLRFPDQSPVHASPLPQTCYKPRPSHSSRFYLPNNIEWAVQITPLYAVFFIPPLPCPS